MEKLAAFELYRNIEDEAVTPFFNNFLWSGIL